MGRKATDFILCLQASENGYLKTQFIEDLAERNQRNILTFFIGNSISYLSLGVAIFENGLETELILPLNHDDISWQERLHLVHAFFISNAFFGPGSNFALP